MWALWECSDLRGGSDLLAKVSEMDAGGDAATPGLPAATSAMSALGADDAWALNHGELQPLARNREAILE